MNGLGGMNGLRGCKGTRRPGGVQPEVLEEWLEATKATPTFVERGRWQFALANGRPFDAEARIEEEWVVFDVPLARLDPWHVLSLNGELRRGARLVLDGNSGTPGLRLRSEVLDCGESALAERLAGARLGLEHGLAVYEWGETEDGRAAKNARDAPPFPGGSTSCLPEKEGIEDPDALVRVGETLERLGWSAREAENGEWSIDLEVPGRVARATLARRGGRELSLAVELVATTPATSLSRHALGTFLLRATPAFRSVRAARRPAENGEGIRLETGLWSDPHDEEIDRGLGALSLATRHLTREAEILAIDEDASREYAALRGIDVPESQPLQEEKAE